MAEITLASILTSIGTVVTEVVSMFTDVIATVTANPLMLAGILIPAGTGFIYAAYRLAKRALRRHG